MRISKTVRVFMFFALLLLSISGTLSSAQALLAGIVFAVACENPYPKNTKKAFSLLLKGCVILLGFGLEISETLSISKETLPLTISSIIITLVVGAILGKLFGLHHHLSYLISCGTAICGGSAIAAIAPIVKPKSSTLSLALIMVFFLNAVALLIFPPIGRFLELSQEQFGIWAAIAIHDTSSVVGAASDFGEQALQLATTVKLGRALWIIPLAVLSAFLFKSSGSRIKFPLFILGFILASLLRSYGWISIESAGHATSIARTALVATLFLVGSTIRWKEIASAGTRTLLFSVSLWLTIAAYSLFFVLYL